MKKFKKIAKWTGIVILFLVAALTVTVALRQNLHYDAPYPSIHASTDSTIIKRGRHLVYSSAHCSDCHSTYNADSVLNLGQEVPLNGGLLFDLPVGKIYTPNITSDPVYGIGRRTDEEIARTLRYGVKHDGTAAFDFMPFHNLSDSDLTAVISFVRTLPPVATPAPSNKLNLLGYIVKAFLVKPVGPSEPVIPFIKPDSTATYGRYLVTSVGNCAGCHTKRDLTGGYTGEHMAGGNELNGIYSPNLTPDSSGRIFNWTQDMFVKRFRMGKLNPKSEMPWNSFKRMTDEDLIAIYKYLRTVKPVRIYYPAPAEK